MFSLWCCVLLFTMSVLDTITTSLCQKCRQLFPRQNNKICYHCIYISKQVICQCCAPTTQCMDCEQWFCITHQDPRVHVRYRSHNHLDTCAKRTACLERVYKYHKGASRPKEDKQDNRTPAERRTVKFHHLQVRQRRLAARANARMRFL